MDETTSSSNISAQEPAINPIPEEAVEPPAAQQALLVETEKPAAEQRKAYGTAKTEDLRDSGIWRILLPVCVGFCCLALLAVPLIILIPLLATSLDATASTHALTWLWITMIVLELGIAAIIIWGLVKIFMTQAGNYPS